MQDELHHIDMPEDFVHIDISEGQATDLIIDAFEGQRGKLSDLNIFNKILYGQDYLQTWGQYTGSSFFIYPKHLFINSPTFDLK